MLIAAKYSFVAGTGAHETAGHVGIRARKVFFKPAAKRGTKRLDGKNKCGEAAVRSTQRAPLFLIPDDFLHFYPSQDGDALMEIATPASFISPLQLLL